MTLKKVDPFELGLTINHVTIKPWISENMPSQVSSFIM